MSYNIRIQELLQELFFLICRPVSMAQFRLKKQNNNNKKKNKINNQNKITI